MLSADIKKSHISIETLLANLKAEIKDVRAAEIILEEVLGVKRYELYLNPTKAIDGLRARKVMLAKEKFLKGMPLQYIFKKAYFNGLELYVDERVLIPRPETEQLAKYAEEEILNRLKFSSGINVLDLGTGSGAIVVYLKSALREAPVKFYATDLSKEALLIAKENESKIFGSCDIEFLKGYWFDVFGENYYGFFDVVVANPPYILRAQAGLLDKRVKDFEPSVALFGIEGPRKTYGEIIGRLGDFLGADGVFLTELSPDVSDVVLQISEKESFKCTLIRDLSGSLRYGLLRRKF